MGKKSRAQRKKKSTPSNPRLKKTLRCEACETEAVVGVGDRNIKPCLNCGDKMKLVKPGKEEHMTAPIATKPGEGRISYKIKDIDHGIFSPELDENFFVQRKQERILMIVHEASTASPQNVMFVGPQGCGKTEMGVWFAAKTSRPCYIHNCGAIREPRDWFGARDAKEGSIFFNSSEFIRAIRTPGCTVILDEFNRLHTANTNTIYPILDSRRRVFVEEMNETIEVAEGVVFFATANIGYAHTGTFTMDSAMEDRWGIRVDVSFLDADKEAQIISRKTGISKHVSERLAKLAGDVRKKSKGLESTLSKAISTRQLLQTAQLMRYLERDGDNIADAFDFTVVPFYSDDGGRDSEQAQVLQLIQGIFGGSAKKQEKAEHGSTAEVPF